MASKPGYKTTEFWTAAPGSAAMLELVRVVQNPYVQVVCVAAAAVVLCWYAGQRTKAKKA
jgi:hypothetical protein